MLRYFLPFISCIALVGKSVAFLCQKQSVLLQEWIPASTIVKMHTVIQHNISFAPPVLSVYYLFIRNTGTDERACVRTLAMLVLGEKSNVFLNATPKDLPLLLMHVQ